MRGAMLAGAADVVLFWQKAGPDRWFKKDTAFDDEIRERFLATHDAAAAGQLSGWEQSAEGALALLILLDQFPRNMMERVTSGEHLIAYGIFGSYALGRSKKDPNLGIILPKDYTMVTSRVAFISKHAKNPNAGKLFLDYILSKRGQEIIANKADLYSLRSDVDGEATIKGVTQLIGDKARPVPIDQTLLENLDQAKRLAFLSKWQQAKRGQ